MSQIIVTGISGADLTAKRGYAVRADGGDTEHIVLADDSTDTETLGILVNNPADETPAHVCRFGICEAYIGGGVEPFDYLMADTDGMLIKHTGADAVAIAQYIPRVKDAGGTLSQADGADGRLLDVFVLGAQIRNPSA